MPNPVSKYFDERTKQREERDSFNGTMAVLRTAIDCADRETVASAFDEVKDSPLLTKPAYDRLLKAAIRTDDTAIFSTILSSQSNPNYQFEFRTTNGQYTDYEHVLSAAIEEGSKNIALLLANNKDVSIDKSGLWIDTTYIGKKFKVAVTPYPTPLEQAEKKGMNEVAAVLARRLSREYAAHAHQARAKMKAATPG